MPVFYDLPVRIVDSMFLGPPPSSEERDHLYENLYALEGWSLRRIAGFSGLSQQRIHQILKQRGVAMRPKMYRYAPDGTGG